MSNKEYGFSITPLSDDGQTGGMNLMSTSLRKVRINILDKDTGEAIEEVDVFTSADSVIFEDGKTLPDELVYLSSYTNNAKTPVSVGGIDEGSTFTLVQFKDLFERLLYPYTAPSFNFTSTLSKRYYEYGVDISPISFITNITKKSENITAVELWRNGSKYDSFKNIPPSGGTGTYNYTEKLNTTSSFVLKVFDEIGQVYLSEPIQPIFNYPVYYGAAFGNVNNDMLKLMNKYIDYENINHIQFTGYVSPDHQGIVIGYKSYIGGNEEIKITDTNGLDITASFEKENIQFLDVLGNMINYTYWKSNITKQTKFKINVEIRKP